jgi:TRAP-type transport system small permease protein
VTTGDDADDRREPPVVPEGGGGGLRRAVRVITGIELGIGALAAALVFLLVLVQALQRYLPVEGWSWTGELARFCLVWLTFTVAGVLVTSDSHISLQLVDNVGNRTVVRVVRVVASLVVAAIGVGFAAEAIALIESQGLIKSPAMQMPVSWLYVLPLLGFVSTAVRGLLAAVDFGLHGVPEAHPEEMRAA